MSAEDCVMRKVERFEDLIAWQKAREFTRAIYEVTRRGAAVDKQRKDGGR